MIKGPYDDEIRDQSKEKSSQDGIAREQDARRDALFRLASGEIWLERATGVVDGDATALSKLPSRQVWNIRPLADQYGAGVVLGGQLPVAPRP